MPTPPGKTLIAFLADDAMARAMQKMQARDGMPLSVQCRRALEAWLPKQDVGYDAKKSKTAKKGRS